MKQCSKCKRVYYDETLNFCLEDGSGLVYAPANSESQTARLSNQPSEAPTRHQFVSDDDRPRNIDKTNLSATSWLRNRVFLAVLIPIVLLAGGFLVYRYVRDVRQIESIAVMPFANASGNPDMEYLSDGITETLIGSLSQLSGLNVKAPSSVFRYKGKEVDAQTIGRELNVQAILNGRVVQ